jgi:nuclear pore complex protein Nup98-Nup96
MTSKRAGFGATSTTNQPSAFGTAAPFGQTAGTGGGLFGGGTGTGNTGGGGFGGFGGTGTTTNNAQTTTSGFGGGIFGGNRPAFGATNTAGGALFGGGTGGTGGFGATNTTQGAGGFGAPASTALGGAIPQSDGTAGTPFQAFTEKDPGSTQTCHYQSLCFMQPYQKFSHEVCLEFLS